MLFARNAYEVFSFYKVNHYEVCVCRFYITSQLNYLCGLLINYMNDIELDAKMKEKLKKFIRDT